LDFEQNFNDFQNVKEGRNKHRAFLALLQLTSDGGADRKWRFYEGFEIQCVTFSGGDILLLSVSL
jgi:hypothetical protein